jgi:hypothetical protein
MLQIESKFPPAFLRWVESLGLMPDDTINNLAGRPVHLAPDGEVPPELM